MGKSINCGVKNRKLLYYKILFWILAIIIPIGVCVAEGGFDNPVVASQENTITQQLQVFNIGDTVECVDGLKITVNGVRTSNGGEFMRPIEGNEYIYVDATIENTSDEDKTISSLLMFDVVDYNGKSMDLVLAEDSNGHLDGTIKPGEKLSGEYVVEAPVERAELEFQFDSSLVGNKVSILLN